MAHRNARLTPFGRLLLVQRIVDFKWPVPRAAEAAGVSRATAYKWLARYRLAGIAGLEDESSRPRGHPRAVPEATVGQVIRLRREMRSGPHRLAPELGLPRSTVYKVLRRQGLSRLRDLDRITAVPIRYVRERPGELLHLDIKKLGRIPPGGGHAFLGMETGKHNRRRGGEGYEFVHVAVDDCSRVAFARVMPTDKGVAAATFLLEAAQRFADLGVRIERVMTDRGFCYTLSPRFQAAVRGIGADHKVTRRYRPQTNGKAEAFIKTLLREWAYARLYVSNDERLATLAGWLELYNHRRPHTALSNRAPMEVLVNKVCGKYT
jgi:transposase InsO family protein